MGAQAQDSGKNYAEAGLQELQHRVASQHAATQSGDPASIEASSRTLAALALQQMANLKMLQAPGQESVELYRRSLALEDSESTRVDLAVALFRTKHNDEARAEVERVLQADPKNARAWELQGSLNMFDGNYAASVQSLTRSVELHTDVNALYALGSSLLRVHEKEKASAVFQQIISLYGDQAIWHVVFGGAYRDADYLQDAIVEFKRAIAIDPKVGHAHFFLGLTYLQANHWGSNPESLDQFQKAIQLEPRNYLVNFYLGALESTANEFAASNKHLHTAAEVEPGVPEIWLYLGLNAFQQENYRDAKTYLKKAIALTGADDARNNYQIRRAYFTLGRIAINEGSRDEGEKLLARVKEMQQKSLANSTNAINSIMQEGMGSAPNAVPAMQKTASTDLAQQIQNPLRNPQGAVASSQDIATKPAQQLNAAQARQLDAWENQLREVLASSFNDLGTADARQQQYAQALASFQEAEKWQPPSPALLRNIGTAAFRLEDYKESARALKLYLQAEPADQRSRMMLAISLFSLAQYADAASAFELAHDAAMQDPRAAYAWAYSLAHSNQQPIANQIADRLAAQQLPPATLSLVCHLYMDTENYEQSAACYRKAYQSDPSLKQAHYMVGESLIRLDRPADAIPELQQELLLAPHNPDVEYSLAYALLLTSHKQEATALLETVIAERPSHAQAQYQLGKLLLEEGKVPEAIEHLEIARQNDPSPDYIHYQLQAAYRRAGRTADADREAKIYRDIKASHREIASPHSIDKQ